ncbi:TraC family protein [Notoacmeibacter sp. MSK16QG-6]|uniref:TraC family protein n=1 Tax=Notoacmeibacter sp. MSK16QG-6 TaxID=2957982 RepID=UPI0020A1A3AB|nr:TraC family protein [Notoacmeibacter sp. MSK16QG-6]MCP1201005.1 TraC family protein [Notoacmeibacter sp. MSK16QG-6]
MKKSSSKIKEDIARMQERLKVAETREAERIGRLAFKAGLGELEIDDAKLVQAFADLAKRFRGGGGETRKSPPTQNPAGASSGANSEA